MKEIDPRKAQIAQIIFELVDAGFEITIGRQYITARETFKSQSRDRYETKEVQSSVGSWHYWQENGNSLNIQLDKLREWRSELLENEKWPLTKREED